ncbi:MAG: GAF domain-containing protein [Bacteroidales bacterium]
MKLISKESKFLPIMILVLLLISVLLAFSKAHNTIVELGQTTSVWLIALTILPAIFGILLYSLLGASKGTISHLEAEVKSLKAALDNSLKTEVKETVVVDTEVKIDVKDAISKIIPNIDLSDIEKYGEVMLANIAKQFQIVQGLLYLKNTDSGVFSFSAGYAFFSETQPTSYIEGDTLPGQVAKNKTVLNLDKVPDGYITILSGLGKGSPKHLLIVPIIDSNSETIGIIELASFKAYSSQHEELFAALGRKLGEVLISNKPISQD